MTVSARPHKNRRYKSQHEYLFIFNSCESLTQGILFLYRLKLNLKSTLYKTETDYRLIIRSSGAKPYLLTLCDFCTRQSNSIIETAYTKEHGKLLIAENAVKTFGKYFFKGF